MTPVDRQADALERIAAALEAVANGGRFVPPRHDRVIGQDLEIEPGDEERFELVASNAQDATLVALYVHAIGSDSDQLTVIRAEATWRTMVHGVPVPKDGLGLCLSTPIEVGMCVPVVVTVRCDAGRARRVGVTAYFRLVEQ